MSLIDQRILIAATGTTVWPYLTDPASITRWHRGCKQVSILTTRTGVVGTTRRITDERGRSIIEEITAWLENLGYEYVMVEGPYRSYKARVRLQPVAEGIIVHWTLDFQLRGPAARFRAAFRARRRMERQMAESLKELRKLVEKSGARVDAEKQARFAMQAAPSVEARAAMGGERTRPERGTDTGPIAPVPSASPSPTRQSDTGGQPRVQIPTTTGYVQIRAAKVVEPPVEPRVDSGASRTPPLVLPAVNPANSLSGSTGSYPSSSAMGAMGATSTDAIDPKRKTSELPRITLPVPSEPDLSVVDTKPRKPKGLAEAIDAAPNKGDSQSMQAVNGEIGDDEFDPSALTVPVSMVAPPRPREVDMVTQTMEVFTPTPKEDTGSTNSPSAPPTLPELVPTPRAMQLPILPAQTNKGDTGEISIWEAFGLQPPSERTRTDLQAIISSLKSPPEALNMGDTGIIRALDANSLDADADPTIARRPKAEKAVKSGRKRKPNAHAPKVRAYSMSAKPKRAESHITRRRQPHAPHLRSERKGS